MEGVKREEWTKRKVQKQSSAGWMSVVCCQSELECWLFCTMLSDNMQWRWMEAAATFPLLATTFPVGVEVCNGGLQSDMMSPPPQHETLVVGCGCAPRT